MTSKISEILPNQGISISNKKPIELKYEKSSITPKPDYIPEPFKNVARGMEEQFAEYMLNEMNKTIDRGNEESGDETGMEFYRSLQKGEQAKLIANKDTLGLQKIILDQIYPKGLRNKVAFEHYQDQINSKKNHILPSYKIEERADTIRKGEEKSSPQ